MDISKRVEFRRVAPIKEGSVGLRFEEFEKIVPCDEREISGWISVKDRLPETEASVLVRYVGVNTGIDFYQVLRYFANDDEPHFQHMLGNKNLKVTHWMPLPKPPKEVTAHA